MTKVATWVAIVDAASAGRTSLSANATEFTQVLFATLFMELRGGLERRRRLVAKAEGREIECPGPALSSALTSCPSWRKLCHNEELQATLINTLSAVRMQPRNRDFEPGFEGPSGVGALDLHVLRVPPPVSPCYGELSPCYGEIISLLPSCSSGIANFPQAIVIKMNFPAKTGPETANSPCFPPVIRENQGPLSNPSLMLPSSLPGKLGWGPGDSRCVNAVAPALRLARASLP